MGVSSYHISRWGYGPDLLTTRVATWGYEWPIEETLEAILQSSLAIEADIKKIVELSGSPGLLLSIDATPCTLYLLDSSAEITGSLVASLDKIQLISSLLQMSGVLSASIIKVRYVIPDLAGGVVYIIGIDGTITVAPIYGDTRVVPFSGKATVK